MDQGVAADNAVPLTEYADFQKLMSEYNYVKMEQSDAAGKEKILKKKKKSKKSVAHIMCVIAPMDIIFSPHRPTWKGSQVEVRKRTHLCPMRNCQNDNFKIQKGKSSAEPEQKKKKSLFSGFDIKKISRSIGIRYPHLASL